MDVRFKAIADHAVLVTFAEELSDEAHDLVLALDRAIADHMPVGVIETVPALVNLLVSFDPVVTDHAAVKAHVRQCLNGMEIQSSVGVVRQVKVCYDPPFAPDLAAVSAATGLSTEAVINAHLAGDFDVLMYGFAPGYAYLSGVPEQIRVPRKQTPVRDVAAGSVIIAGAQCLITTLTMPTGWSIIGRSPTQVLTGDPAHPFLFDVGDRVTFQRIDMTTYDKLRTQACHG